MIPAGCEVTSSSTKRGGSKRKAGEKTGECRGFSMEKMDKHLENKMEKCDQTSRRTKTCSAKTYRISYGNHHSDSLREDYRCLDVLGGQRSESQFTNNSTRRLKTPMASQRGEFETPNYSIYNVRSCLTVWSLEPNPTEPN